MILKELTNLGYTTQNNYWGYLTNKELAKHDVLLQFNIDKGECDWNPELGTSMRKMIFAKKTDANKSQLISEIQEVFKNEPRFELLNLETTELDKGWIFTCIISYLGGTPEEWVFSVNRTGKASVGHYPLK
jgi:phage baseplate assembly protein W